MSLNGLKAAVETEWVGAEVAGIGHACGSPVMEIDARGSDEAVRSLVNDFGFEVVGVSPVDSSTVRIRAMEE